MRSSGLFVDDVLIVVPAFKSCPYPPLSLIFSLQRRKMNSVFIGRHMGNMKVEVTSVDKDPPNTGLQALIT